MRQVAFADFQKCEKGTVFSFMNGVEVSSPCVLIDWYEPARADFVYAEMSCYFWMNEAAPYFAGPGVSARWGMFNAEATFVVYHQADCVVMAKQLLHATEPPFEPSGEMLADWWDLGLYAEDTTDEGSG